MSEPATFTEDELRMIVVTFMQGTDDRFYGRPAEWDREQLAGFCGWCKHQVSPVGEHSPSCEGQARQAVAHKAKRELDRRGRKP